MTDFLDFQALARPTSPNTYLLAPSGFADEASPDAESPVFDCTPAELFSQVEALVASRKDWRLKALDAQAGRISFIAVTRFFRFKDDVDIAVLPAWWASFRRPLLPERFCKVRCSRSRFRCGARTGRW